MRLNAEEVAIVDVALVMARATLSDRPDGRYLAAKMTAMLDRIRQHLEDRRNGDV